MLIPTFTLLLYSLDSSVRRTLKFDGKVEMPNGKVEMPKAPKKDYSYRSTWKHKLSRAQNLAHRGGLSKKEMMKTYGRFPKKNEWWGPEKNLQEWKEKWVLEHPPVKT